MAALNISKISDPQKGYLASLIIILIIFLQMEEIYLNIYKCIAYYPILRRNQYVPFHAFYGSGHILGSHNNAFLERIEQSQKGIKRGNIIKKHLGKE